nr:InlB B-repeat-containing protein [Microbacterium immunditiarum]
MLVPTAAHAALDPGYPSSGPTSGGTPMGGVIDGADPGIIVTGVSVAGVPSGALQTQGPAWGSLTPAAPPDVCGPADVVVSYTLGGSALTETIANGFTYNTPCVPRNVSVAAGDAAVTVTFDAPVGDGGSPITGYTITAHPNGSPGGTTVTVAGSPATITGLLNGTAYTVEVVAYNANGPSLPSPLAGPATPTGPVTLTFDANGGTGTMNPQTSSTPTPLAPNLFIRAGFFFDGWNTAADGSGTSYPNQAQHPFTANGILYAQWDDRIRTVGPWTVTFDANGGTGTMSPQSEYTAAVLHASAFTRDGHAFTGWNTAADGSGTTYADGQTHPFTADETLYAQWASDPGNDPSTDPPTDPPTGTPDGDAGQLAATGASDAMPPLITAVALVSAGIAILIPTLRRRREA